MVSVDRGSLSKEICGKYGYTRRVTTKSGKLYSLDIYYDNTFIELDVNKGEEWMAFRAYPENQQIKIK